MRIKKACQLSADQLKGQKFDLVLCASGYEARARYLVEFLSSGLKSANRICLKFDNHKADLNRQANDDFFAKTNFATIETSGNDDFSVIALLDKLFKDYPGKSIDILVDYSSMTRIWYGAILKYFKFREFGSLAVNLFFSYSSSTFSRPPAATVYNRHVAPIDGFYSLSIPNKPTALLIGLGYIESRSFGLAEFFDVKPFLFIADPSSSNEFYEEVIKNNKHLLQNVPRNHIFNYPLNNVLYTESLLYTVCKDLLSEYRIVLAPCGPKPFSLLCLAMSMRLPSVDVWRISAGQDEPPVDKIPSKNITVLHYSLESQ